MWRSCQLRSLPAWGVLSSLELDHSLQHTDDTCATAPLFHYRGEIYPLTHTSEVLDHYLLVQTTGGLPAAVI